MTRRALNSRSTKERPASRKTFTGCWTCRARKLKCDETYPQCRQCTKKNLACEGYSTRLQWLPFEAGSSDGAAAPIRTTTSQRRQIIFSIPDLILDDSELDRLLLDTDGDDSLSPQTRLHGPFGVFSAKGKGHDMDFYSSTYSCLPLEHPPEHHYTSQPPQGQDRYIQSSDLEPLYSGRRESAETSNLEGIWAEFSPEAASIPSLSTADLLELLEARSPLITPGVPENNDQSDEEVRRNATSPLSDSLTLATQPSPFFMKPETRFLLNHYVHNVVNYFCVVASDTRSPWKAIHLPRAMQGSGELEVMGVTSHARNALLNALLAVSAYSLSSQYDLRQGDQVEKWRRIGSQLRSQAVKSLQMCLAENMTSSSKPKYKELLAAMLSMVSVDVASGETATTQMHLLGSESLIRSTKGWKMRYSSKARSLHRIFYYLQVIYASTSPIDIFAANSGLDSDESNTIGNASTSPSTRSWLEEDLSSSSEKIASCEFIYGVPASLLMLLGRVTDLVKKLERLRRMPQQLDNTTATALANASDQLEAEILDYPVDEALRFLDALTPENKAIVEHQTRGFHHAIIIYFSQNVRSMHTRYMKPYVEAVISHAEAIEQIKQEHKVAAGSLFWPCFVAALEAVDEDLQQRFVTWYNVTKVCGFASCLRGRDIVTEVWRRRRSGCSRQESSWRKVAEAQKVCLMLT